jgi:S1-C subfamily serine protease
MMTPDCGYGLFPKRRGRGNVLMYFLTAVLGAVLGTVLLLALTDSDSAGATLPGGHAAPVPAGSAPPGLKSQRDIIAKVKPGVVIINTMLQYSSEAAAGTGVVLKSDGLVLTNNHVIQDSTSITATVPSTGKTYTAHVLGYDKTADIALIKLQSASGLTTVPVGNSASVKPGELVVALGNANGENAVSAAPGQVTQVGQTITASDDAGSASTETLHEMIQTNADIVAGDSGGPLSSSGGVIGMDTAGNSPSSQQQATGFAIPINTALGIARQIAADRASATVAIGYPGFMGIFIGSGSDRSPQAQAKQQQQRQRQQPGSPGSPSCSITNAGLVTPSAIAPVSSGVLVDGTICGSPAAQAGMTSGAVITAVDGHAVGSPDDLGRVLARFHPRDTLSVTWVNPAGHRMTRSVRLGAGPPQ